MCQSENSLSQLPQSFQNDLYLPCVVLSMHYAAVNILLAYKTSDHLAIYSRAWSNFAKQNCGTGKVGSSVDLPSLVPVSATVPKAPLPHISLHLLKTHKGVDCSQSLSHHTDTLGRDDGSLLWQWTKLAQTWGHCLLGPGWQGLWNSLMLVLVAWWNMHLDRATTLSEWCSMPCRYLCSVWEVGKPIAQVVMAG